MDSIPPSLNLHSLSVIRVLGKGAMGTVFLVSDPSFPSPFALKVVSKSSFRTKFDAERRARWEISVLSRLAHPFLPSLLASLDTPDFIAWALPYCPGGDLNVLRYRQNDRIFSPPVIRFYAAELVCALDHLHSLSIVYRDLKPENVLLQANGHVTLTDFDLSRVLNPRTTHLPAPTPPEKKHSHANGNAHSHANGNAQHSHAHFGPGLGDMGWRSIKHRRNLTRVIFVASEKGLKKVKSARVAPVTRRRPSFSNGERSNSFVGTEEYVSPEVVRGDGHEFAVDWWSLGILLYELMYGRTPFRGHNRKETFRNVLTKDPEFFGKRTDLIDLIEQLLHKDPTKRLGYRRGAAEIKEHPFFSGLRWDLLTEVMRPPFITPLVEEPAVGQMDIKEYFEPTKPASPQSPSDSPDLSFEF